MEQREVKISITYRWWKDDDGKINQNHIEELDTFAEQYILESQNDGYTSGELLYTVEDDNNSEMVEYKGWWERTTEVK